MFIDLLLEKWLRGPDHPAKLRLFSWLVRHLRDGRLIVRISDSRLSVDIEDYIGHCITYSGCYERNSVALARKLMSNGGTFIDIGANIGLYSILVSEIGNTNVVSFEPDAYNFSRLKYNVALNARTNITLCHFPLSDTPQVVPFHVPSTGNMGSARIVRSDAEVSLSKDNLVLLATSPFDSVARMLSIQNVTLLKIDVEGHELQVLRGFNWQMHYRPKHIICEYLDHDQGKAFEETVLSSFLAERRYVAHDIFGKPLRIGAPIPDANVWFIARPVG